MFLGCTKQLRSPPTSTDRLSNLAATKTPAGTVVWDYQIGAGGDGAIKPPTGAKLIDVDGWGTSAAKVAQLKAQGLYRVCRAAPLRRRCTQGTRIGGSLSRLQAHDTWMFGFNA